LADAGSATNRLLVRVPPADLEKTVLTNHVKSAEPEKPLEPEKPAANESPKSP
jgi:hypothetical protein